MITEFLSKIRQTGVASSARFVCQITPPLGVSLPDDIRFSIESTEFPTQRIETKEYRSYGTVNKFAYQRSNDDLNITFRCSDSMIEKTIFDKWLGIIYNNDTGNVKYRLSAVGTINIYQIGWNGQSPYSVEISEAFPISVSDLSLDWGSQSTYHKFTVSFSYNTWKPVIKPQIMFFGTDISSNQNGTTRSELQNGGAYLPVTKSELRGFVQQNDNQPKNQILLSSLAKSGGTITTPLSSQTQLRLQSSLLNSPSTNIYGNAQNILTEMGGNSTARNMMAGAVNSSVSNVMGGTTSGMQVPSYLNGIGLPSRIGMPDIFTRGLTTNTFTSLTRIIGSTGLTQKFMRNLPPTTATLLNYSLAKILGR
jgi:hypothetical protein